MDTYCGSTSRPRRPKARNLVFGADLTPTKGYSPVCKLAIAICSATDAHSPQRLRSRNAVIEARFYMKTRFFLTQILCSLRDWLLSLSITMATQNSNLADDLRSAARLPNMMRPR